MIPVMLSLNDKNVLIVGGGKVALRKAKQYLAQKAIVTILSPSFLEDFKELDCHLVTKNYETSDLKDCFLVYASTNDKVLNQEIIKDCNTKGILCGSATYDGNASFYSMAKEEGEIGTIALSTNQKLPYSKPIMKALKNTLDSFNERVEILANLRSQVIEKVATPRLFFELAFEAPVELLRFLNKSMDKEGYLYLYHPSEYEESFNFLDDLSIALDMSTFAKFKDLFIFSTKIHVIPLVVKKGYIYSKMEKLMDECFSLKEPLIKTQKDINHVLSLYKKENKKLLVIIHQRNDDELKKEIICELKDDGEVYELDEALILEKNQSYQVLLFLMTHGKHYHDLEKMISNYQSQGYDIESLGILSENKDVIDLLKDKH